MNKMKKVMTIGGIALTSMFALTACGSVGTTTQQDEVAKKAATSEAYIPKNTTELDNYNAAQKVYDDPNSILWCTAFPSSPSAPIITVPIAGKLTTSGTSYFNPQEVYTNGSYGVVLPSRSVDGLFHGDSFYRFGFSPAGVMVDFSNSMELMCSTQLTEYSRQNTFVEGVDTTGNMDAKQKKAEEALKAGDGDKAADILAGK